MHLIAFIDVKSKHFSNTLRDSNLYVINCIHQLVASSLKNWATGCIFYMRASSVVLLRESVSQSKVATRLLLNVCCASEACKYKKRNHNGGHDDLLHNCNIVCKKHTADLALIAS